MKSNSKLLSAFRTKLIMYVVSIAAVFALGGMVTYQVTKAQVTVSQEGKVTTVRTHADTVEEVLKELNIQVDEHDELSHDLKEDLTSGMNIKHTKAVEISVITDGEENTYFTTAGTVGEFLKENEIVLNEHDEFSHENTDSITAGDALEIKRAFQVTLDDGGEESKIWTTAGGTVKELLNEQNIKLGELDRVNVESDEEVSKDKDIVITRVEKVTDVMEESIDFSVVKKEDDSLEKGKEEVVSPGEEGVLVKHYEVTMENGKEVDRKLVKEEVEKESEQRIVAVGTKVNKPAPVKTVSVSTSKADSSNSSNSSESPNSGADTVSRGDADSSKSYYMHATAYSAQCSGCSGITATGINLKSNPNAKVIAVDPNVIPLGSKVWVEGYGTAIAGDTGGAIHGNKIDVHMPSSSAAKSFGSKKVQVKVLD
ncbi:G5 and 3D domain-containing protein [Sediminibacillus massiliensis]|uniref:G5 and 3D domain-containing protein n=1 Tax=Sediminibacillus massiliensis TaxID=1926277 RepID=UPI00098886D2|nr:G5 and 3D domain-containing protein [Sediminibacillus massiliensis]